MRSSSGGTWVAGSERPVPRLSHTMTRIASASCSMTAVNGLRGSSYISTLLNQPGIQTRVVSPSPNSRYASRTSPLRAYRTRPSLTRSFSHFTISTRTAWPAHRRRFNLKPPCAVGALLTPSRPENETAGNERDWTGTRRNETAVQNAFCMVKAGVRVPLAPPLAPPLELRIVEASSGARMSRGQTLNKVLPWLSVLVL